jgi:hypothetical protein
MRSLATTHATHAGQRTTRRPKDSTVILVMVGITLLILGFVAIIRWTASRSLSPVVAATSVDTATLLPLAAPVNPVVGGHDMNNMPDTNKLRPHTLAAGAPQPNVDLPLARWDWGTIPAIPAVAQIFPIQNTGSQPLLITSVVTSCGCTSAALSSSVIPPGQRADLKVTFDPNFHATSGAVTRLIWLQTNDPDLPLVEIRLDANVTP